MAKKQGFGDKTGRKNAKKGTHIKLIRSFKIITNQNPHVTLTIAGEIDEGNPSSLNRVLAQFLQPFC